MSPSNRLALFGAAGISLSLLLLARLLRRRKNKKKSKPHSEDGTLTKRAGSRQQGVKSPSGRSRVAGATPRAAKSTTADSSAGTASSSANAAAFTTASGKPGTVKRRVVKTRSPKPATAAAGSSGAAAAAADASSSTAGPFAPVGSSSAAPQAAAASLDAAEAQRRSSRSSASPAGGSTPGSSSKQPRLTVADVIRESIKLKQKNERLRQQLNLRPERSERRSSSSSGRSSGRSGSSSSSRSGNGASSSSTAAAAAAAPDAEATSSRPSSSNNGSGNGSSSSRRVERGEGSSSSGGSSSRSALKLSAADIMREMAGLKAENMEMVKLLAAQLAEVRAQNAELMAAFHRRETLAAVQEDPEGERSSKGASGAAAGGLLGGTEGGNSTPNTGSELGSFKDRLRLPGFGRAPGSTGGSDAGSSLRSAPAGIGSGSKSSRGGLWRWASGGRRAGGAMTADNASIPDSMGSPRSNASVPIETLVDLLDWGAR
ncbi:hypothetical protein OEZ85_007424 [Tetradesmus obliquus]|uniref:Uncharacterized protein n=1 Tax=Tetradesmus obliquus TaxID=3088 RepID=A0ABY8TFX4_TETOB|nr:hypothetical protein OEZ85_007424 [Tetradesmus obliquus]